MSLGVGQFAQPRRTVRSEINPMDKSTIVSIYPREISERNFTVEPGLITVPQGSIKTPSCVVVGTASWWRDFDPDQPLLEIVIGSVRVAEGFVRDFCSGLVGFRADYATPGLFTVPGAHDSESIKKNFPHLLVAAEARQRNWYSDLVGMADALWARSGNNPLVISNDMKMAAHELNVENKEWLSNLQQMELTRCKACGTLVRPDFPVCPNCKVVINEAKAKELNLRFVQ